MGLPAIFGLGAVGLLLGLLPGVAAAVPNIEQWTTENGARVYFISATELPIVDVRVVFDAGSARDGDTPGLARLTNTLFDSGTAELSADEVAERLDEVGARLGSGTGRDMAQLSLRSLSEPQYLTPALNTFIRLLNKPAFAPEALERERQRMIAAVKARNQSPGELAELAFYRNLYGDHPYASPPDGEIDSLEAITRDDVQSFYDRYYVAANAVVVIVGDLDRSQAEQLANKLAGDLPAGEPAPELASVQSLSEARAITVAHPSSQSHIRIGQVGISRGDPDYYSLYLGNHILGGNGLVSRLAEEVRRKRGLSYSVYSYFAPMQQDGPFVIGLQTSNQQVKEAIQVATTTLQDFVKNGPGTERLEEARQNIIGSFAQRIDSNNELAQYLGMIGFYDLPLDYLQTLPDKIRAVSLEEVTQAFDQHIHPQQLLTVTVGGE